MYCYNMCYIHFVGVKVRRRSCYNEYNRTIDIEGVCPGRATEVISCHTKNCRQDGGWSSWLSWGACSKLSCSRRRIRLCNNPVPKNNGR